MKAKDLLTQPNHFLTDFKKFIMRGNVVDMAVGVVVGGAFSKIVSSLVSDVIMPLAGMVTGTISLSDLALTLTPGHGDIAPVLLRYGVFLQNIVDFLLVALCIFVVIRLMGTLQRKAPPAPAPVPKLSDEAALLTEIRDLLREEHKPV